MVLHLCQKIHTAEKESVTPSKKKTSGLHTGKLLALNLRVPCAGRHVSHVCNLSTCEMDAGGLQVRGKCGLQSKTLPSKQNIKMAMVVDQR